MLLDAMGERHRLQAEAVEHAGERGEDDGSSPVRHYQEGERQVTERQFADLAPQELALWGVRTTPRNPT